MYSEEEFDFTIVADNLFSQNDTDINFTFDITWKDKSSKLIVNCREGSRRGTQYFGISKIKSFTISEFEAVHNELSFIEPRIATYFPTNFTFNLIEIERINEISSWNFFSLAPASIVQREREFSEETIEAIDYYLRAVTEICGKKLLFSVIFKENNIEYFEDHDIFMTHESKKKIEQCEIICKKLLGSHGEIENLKNLTEDLYIKEDQALNDYEDALFNDSLMTSLSLSEENENLKVKLEKVLSDLQMSDIGPKIISDLRSSAEKFIQQYYEGYRQILTSKIKVSRKRREMYQKYLQMMMKDKPKYQPIIFRDYAGDRLSRLSKNFHKENEMIAKLNLDFHSSKDIIVMRKVELIRSWTEGQEKVRANVRHEDVSLIQLKHIDISNVETSLIDEYYAYIKETYKLLLEHNESQRLSRENLRNVLEDPLHVVLLLPRRINVPIQMKSSEKEAFLSIDYSGVINQDGDESDFEDALDEDEFSNIKKTEIEKLKLKSEYENFLKDIANKRAELRNFKAKLEIQYERLVNKCSERAKSDFESLHLESLHPEKNKSRRKPVSGSSLTPEERKEEAKKARERIKKYQEKLRPITEQADSNSSRIEKKKSGRSKPSPRTDSPLETQKDECAPKPSHHVPLPASLVLNAPPPPGAPPPPPPNVLPTVVPIHSSATQAGKSNVGGNRQQTNGGFLDELQLVFSKRKVQKTSSAIDDDILNNKSQNRSHLISHLNIMIDNRRQFISSQDNSD